MPKKLLNRLFPHAHAMREHRSLRFFGTLLHDPNIWHMNRRSVAGAFAVGLFMAFVPIPSQMIAAAALAILFRVNLPISVALVWITNPLTMAPVFYSAYKLGQWVLGTPHVPMHFELSLDWLMSDMLLVWRPFLLGCFILSAVSAAAGYVGIRLFWRLYIIRKLEEKRRRAPRQP